MSANAFGGVRAGASAGRFSAMVTGGAGAGSSVPGGSVGAPAPPAGSPYTSSPVGASLGQPTHRVLLALVALEVVALVALRGGFRHYHGG